MAATSLSYRSEETPAATDRRLVDLATLANAEIVTSLVATIGENLHSLFDPISDDALPIYFGPLLGRLYLEGL